MQLNLTVSGNVGQLADDLAEETLSGLSAAVADNRPYLIGVPAGRTLAPVVDALERKLSAHPSDLDALTIVMMDDYVMKDASGNWATVPVTAHFSCRRFGEEMRDRLNLAVAGKRGIPQSQVWSPDPANPSEYDRLIANAGGIDLFFVALGAGDGHVAFNPPGSALDSRTRIIELASTTRVDNVSTFPEFGGVEHVPTHGVSVGLASIADARRLEVVAHGSSKAPAVSRLLAAGGFDVDWPATFAYTHPNVRVRIDAAAHSLVATGSVA